MSYPMKTEIITISDSEEDETDATPKRKANLLPFVPLKRICPIRTPFWDKEQEFKGSVNNCASPHHNAESSSQESRKNEFEKNVMEKAALQKQLDESKKKVEMQKEENSSLYRKLSEANSNIESQKSLILSLQKDVEENKSKAAKWENKFIKMKQSMLEVNSSLHDLLESCIKDDTPRQFDLNKKECNPGSNASSTPNMPNTDLPQGQNFTAGSSDTLTNQKHKSHLNVTQTHGVKNLKPTDCGSTGKSKARQTIHKNVPRPRPEKTTKIKELPKTDNKDDLQPEPLNFSEVQSVKDEDSVKLETDSKYIQQKRTFPRRARNVPLRFEEEFNTDFSIRRAKPKKCEKIPLWPVSKLHGNGHCNNGFMCTCGREFKDKTELWNHIKPHIQKRRFTCFICGAGFNELEQAHRHVQKVHRC